MKYYRILLLILREETGECHVVFPSVTFQNPEEGGKTSETSVLNKKIDIMFSFLNFGLPHQNPLNLEYREGLDKMRTLVCQPKATKSCVFKR